jgi:hypothetical protein
VLPPHTPSKVPAIELGVPGLLARVSVLLALVPAMQLEAFTLKVPETKEALKLMVAVVVPCPEITVALVGAVQL